MDTKAVFIARRLSSLSFTFGAISVILGLLLTISPITADAAGEVNSRPEISTLGDCGSGSEFKIDLTEQSNGYTYTSDQIITSVVIKAGSELQGDACFAFTSDGSDGCYAVTGLGSKTVTVSEIGVGGDPDCKDISHIEFFTNPPPVDKPTPTPTSTTTTVVPPLAGTPTPTPTGTATETVPPPVIPPTVTPTSTGTDIVMPPVPTTPTSTGTVLPPVPSVTVTPTSTVLPPVSASPTPTDIVMPPAQTKIPGTLPPPSAPQPRFKEPELVPVTGSDRLMIATSKNTSPQELFTNAGFGLLGLSLVFYGVSKKLQK